MPLQYIDYFFRYIVIAFTIVCIAFVAHPYNRLFIRSDSLRILLSIGLLMCFNHVSSFNLINSWYVGFFPIIFVSLSRHRFKNEFHMILYAAFSLAVTLTKPSIILLPVVVYRVIKHKEYLLGAIISFGIVLQTMSLLTSGYFLGFPPIQTGLLGRIVSTLLYPSVLFHKMTGIVPLSIVSILFVFSIIAMFIYATSKKIGIIATTCVVLVLLGASYTALFSPDSSTPSVVWHYEALFYNDMKIQRELIIRLMLLTLFFTTLGVLYEKHTGRLRHRKTIFVVGFLLLVALYRPIDVTSASVVSTLPPFRNEIAKRTVDCIPIPPHALWLAGNLPTPSYPWYFDRHNYTACGRTNYGKLFRRSSITIPISETQPIVISYDNFHTLTALSLPVGLNTKDDTAKLTLTDMDNGQKFTTYIDKRQADKIANPIFNLTTATRKTTHRFRLTSSNPNVYTGKFEDGTPLAYIYYSLIEENR